MNNPEFDMLCIGISIGVPFGTWLGYRLSRVVRRKRSAVWEKPVKNIPSFLSHQTRPKQDARRVMQKPQVIPLPAPLSVVEAENPTREWRDAWPKVATALTNLSEAAKAAPNHNAIRVDVVSALIGAGYKKVAAVVAVDAVAASDRATVEQWTIAALRRAASK